MDKSPFEDLLKLAAEDLAGEVEAGLPMTEDAILFILRKWFNPFPQGPKDTFATLFKIPGQK